MAFDWKKLLYAALAEAPAIVKGVLTLKSENDSGADKTKMANDSLLVATSIAAGVDPQDHEAIAAASDIASAVIASTQQAHANGAASLTPAAAPAAS